MTDPVSTGTIGAIGTALKGLKTVKDLAESMEVKAKLSEVYDIIIAGQQSAFEDNIAKRALLDEIGDLKEQLAKLEGWDSEKQRYQLVTPFNGAVVYALKKAAASEEPPHYICTNCYQTKRKSLLNRADDAKGWTVLACPACKSHVPTGYRGAVPLKYAEEVITQ